MIPAIAEKKRCPKCNTTLNHFGNTEYCPNCGHAGVGYQGSTCPRGCDPKLSVRVGDGMHCNACGKDWLA
jgi:hypothetical protein